MSKIKVAVVNTVGKTVSIDPTATKGATLGTNLFLPSGAVATPATARQWLGIGTGEGAFQHADLGGLKAGDDHPQYTMWAAKEQIKGQWNFVSAIWGANGTAALPEFTFTSDTDTGVYRVGSDNIGLSTGGVLHWDINTTRVFQDVSQIIRNNDGIYVQVPTRTWCGLQVKVQDGAVDGDVTLWFWETDGTDPDNEINGFRWHLDGTPVGEAYLKLFRHNDNPTGIEVMRVTRTTAGVDFFEQVRGIAGTFSDPSYSFTGDPDTGMYSSTANQLSFSAGGLTGLRIHTGIVQTFRVNQTIDGTAGAPSYSFTGDPNSGIFSAGANQIGFSTDGVERVNLSATRMQSRVPIYINPDPQTIPAAAIAADTGMLLADNAAIAFQQLAIGSPLSLGNRFISAGGTFAVPTAVDTTSINYLAYMGAGGYDGTNWQLGSASLVGIRPSGTWSGTSRPTRITFEVTAASSTTRALRAQLNDVGQFEFSSGTASLPGLTFMDDLDTGIHLASGDTLGLTTGGTERLRINNSGAWGLSGANYGSDGQILTTHGNGTAPTWEDPPAGGGGGGSLVYVNTSVEAGDTVANTTTETAFTAQYEIPANQLTVGTVIRMRLWGVYGTDAVAPTLRVRVKLDATTVLDTTATTLPSAQSNDGWEGDVQCVVHADGASGEVNSQALFEFAPSTLVNVPNAANATIDTTVAQTMTVTVQWGAADADNTITLQQMAIWLEAAVTPTTAAPADATYLTEDDETDRLPNSRRLIAGSNITFDDSVAGQRTISSSGGGGGGDISAEILADSPTGYWKLDEASGNFADSSGSGNTLVASGSIRYQNMYLDRNNPATLFAYFPSAAGAWIAGSLGVAVPLTGDWTIEGIAYFPLASGSSGCIFGIGKPFVSSNNNFQALFYRSTATVRAFWEQGSGSNVETAAPAATTWPEAHHFVLVKDGTANTVTFYVDGVQFGDPQSYSAEPTGGTDVNSGVGAIPGQTNTGCGLGHVAFYNGVKLSNARIAAHAAAAGY